ncbi:MAG TPA: tetratricopeptide repeat protein [Vicinamibacterales bacterium]|nr:tetratricopeptide repeat protein [Vicinamibacterales bacterium]
MARRFTLLGLAVALTAFTLTPRVTAEQASAATSRVTAEKSYRGGRYDEIETIAKAFPKDEAIAVYYALGVAARGDYAKAESILQPFASANPGGDAALELGLLQLHIGKKTEARRALQLVLMADGSNPSAREYLRAARASRALNRVEDAQSFFRDANGLAPNDPRINTEWGELFLEKYNKAEAAKSFQEALKVDPEYGPALLGMAQALADENPPQAIVFAQRVLKQNPNDAGAELVLAQVAIYQDKKADVKAAVDRVLAFNPKHLEGLSMKAAMAYVEGRDQEYQAAVAEALKIHPTYGEIHRVVGEVTAHYYRFDEAVDHTRKAIALDRDNIRAVADLGAQLMRTGDERNARRNLETAFRIDKWDVQTYNLLELLDNLEPFDTINEGDMVIRLAPDETPVMKNYVPMLAKESLATLSKRWEFTPKGPILVEMFPKHDDFAVRTLGLPGMIGALGACFGRVVTLDSPTAREPGTFNWGETLWHELAHVITLQLSGNRLPRWLSEGTSVFEERRARSDWGRDMDIPFARAIDRGAVLKIRDLNSGFSSSQTINFAYYQASLIVEHIHDTYGQRKLRALIEAYADGSDTEAAIKKSLGIDIDELQKGFDESLEKRYAGMRRALKAPEGLKEGMSGDQLKALAAANPDNFTAQMMLGESLAQSNPDAAIAAFEKAAQILPNVRGEDSPQAAIAALAAKKGDKARAARALEALTTYDHTNIQAARELAMLVDPVKETNHLEAALKRVVSVDPFDGAAHSQLGKLAMNKGETAEAVRLFRVALAAKPMDKASAHADLAEALYKAGQRDEARKEVLEALLIAPTYTRAQDLLLKLQEGGR